jgi:hypothetical protein
LAVSGGGADKSALYAIHIASLCLSARSLGNKGESGGDHIQQPVDIIRGAAKICGDLRIEGTKFLPKISPGMKANIRRG